MPLNPSAGVGANIREFRKGPSFAHTAKTFGRSDANRQAVAVAMETARRARRRSYADGGAAFGTTTPQEDADTPPNVLDNIVSGIGKMGSRLMLLPQRALENAQFSLDTGNYDPGPTLQAATLPIGTGALATLPIKGGMSALPTGLKYTDDLIDTAAQAVQSLSSPTKPPRRANGRDDSSMNRGGSVSAAMDIARKVRRASGGKVHVGPIRGNKGGRTDVHEMAVPDGAYVLSADVVSHLGENNTDSGLKAAQHLFGEGGINDPDRQRAAGGRVGKAVPCITAAGEFVVHPRIVKNIGKGDVDFGHKILDHYSMMVRKDHIKTLAHLPPPAKD